MPEKVIHRDVLYLFACHLEWHRSGNLTAYQELVAALDDCDHSFRSVAETLLNRKSPRPRLTVKEIETW